MGAAARGIVAKKPPCRANIALKPHGRDVRGALLGCNGRNPPPLPVHCASITPELPKSHATMKQHLAVSAIGSDRTGMVHELTRVISECGGNISESRMASLGTEFAMLLLVSGNWHALAKLETELKRLAETNGLSVHLKRTEPRSPRTDMLPYSIDVVCLDQSGIVSGLSGFFSSRGIDIAEVSTRSYPAAHTGAPMFSVQMIVNVPSRIHVAHLREEFMEFCDSLNLDAILEPVKS